MKTRILSALLVTFCTTPINAAPLDNPSASMSLSDIDADEASAFSFDENAPQVSGQEFSDFFNNEANYQHVYRNVMSWFGSTNNACVAFASTALRFIGISVPQNGLWNGERVSLLTKPFSSYLENHLGWMRIRDSRALQPGDLIFTVDEPKAPGYPAHVFMHAGYVDAEKRVSWAVDNQGFTHPRALAGDVKKDYSAFAYALRMP